ncbi:hypothetical protein AB0K12_35980 [Nonomuraea sp. NPDC049419]|uniref:hypothetical protein n=1 Tax=Nonomuraea sp. NPDC049419 TaxID=3155772 RepID=UPI0034487E78
MMANERFPGRWIEGAGLILGPILVLAGVLLKLGHDAFFPEQLAAFATGPARMTAAYSCFAAGLVLLAAVLALDRKPQVHGSSPLDDDRVVEPLGSTGRFPIAPVFSSVSTATMTGGQKQKRSS